MAESRKVPVLASIVFGVTAYFLLFMICFLVCFKLVVDSNFDREHISVNIPQEDRIEFYISNGANTREIAGKLKKNNIISSTFIFRFISNINGFDGDYKQGTHIISKNIKYDQLMAILTSYPEGIKVMIPEGYNNNQIADKLAEAKLIDKADFLNTIDTFDYTYEFTKDIPKDKSNRLEGFLFPDTYIFDKNEGSIRIIDRMLMNFDNKFPPYFYQRAKQMGLTAYEVITLASIVEKEASEISEMHRVAGVFLNRLSGKYDIVRRLDSCATIQYIIYSQTGQFKQKLSNEDTKIESPFNTYINEGLPPGPICNPGLAAIEAVLNPEIGNFLFFVSKGDGTHYFSTTLEEHNYALSIYGYNQWTDYTIPIEDKDE